MARINSRIFLLASLIIFAALLVFGMLLLRQLGLLAQELSGIRAELLGLDLKLKNLKTFEKILAETEARRRSIERIFVSPRELADFIEDLEKVGRESRVELQVESAAINEVRGENPSFRLKTEGDFESVFRSLFLTENLPYELAFSEVRLEKKESSWSGFYVLKLVSYEF